MLAPGADWSRNRPSSRGDLPGLSRRFVPAMKVVLVSMLLSASLGFCCFSCGMPKVTPTH